MATAITTTTTTTTKYGAQNNRMKEEHPVLMVGAPLLAMKEQRGKDNRTAATATPCLGKGRFYFFSDKQQARFQDLTVGSNGKTTASHNTFTQRHSKGRRL